MLLPVALTVIRAIAELILPKESQGRHLAETLDEPTVALLAGCLLAVFTRGSPPGWAGRRWAA